MQLLSTLFLAGLAAASPAIKRAEYPKFYDVTPAQVAAKYVPQEAHTFAAQATVQTVGAYFCTDANGQGTCAYVLNVPNTCASVEGTPFQDTISFFDPSGNANTPAASCTVFVCQGRSEVINVPFGNLAVDGDTSFDNAISSFNCVVKT
ncbi:MAG: hypothetical protein Q9227_002782 [Pyrenula ochraceoflavens]